MLFILIYITNPSFKTAEKIGMHLLKEKLAACINIFPITSKYFWKGKIVKEKEFVLIVKAPSKNYEKIRREVEKVHPYRIPCIIKIPVTANKAYEKWIFSECL